MPKTVKVGTSFNFILIIDLPYNLSLLEAIITCKYKIHATQI